MREYPNLVCFNCDNLSHISKECPESAKCCICKSLDHLSIKSEYLCCSSVINSASASSCHNSSFTKFNAKLLFQLLLTPPLSWCMLFILFSRTNHAFNSILSARFDLISDSTFFQFIVSAVHKDQSSWIYCPG